MHLEQIKIKELSEERSKCINKLLKLNETLLNSDFENNYEEFLRIAEEKNKELSIYKKITMNLNIILEENSIPFSKENSDELIIQENNFKNFIELDRTLIEKIQFKLNNIKDKLKKEKMQSKIYNAYKAF